MLSAVSVREGGGCVDLDSPAKSFHVGVPFNTAQVPEGKTVKGYAEKGCRGSLDVQIAGPSSGDICYTTGLSMGYISKVNSVKSVKSRKGRS